jgi:hypothetical protein
MIVGMMHNIRLPSYEELLRDRDRFQEIVDALQWRVINLEGELQISYGELTESRRILQAAQVAVINYEVDHGLRVIE